MSDTPKGGDGSGGGEPAAEEKDDSRFAAELDGLEFVGEMREVPVTKGEISEE
jgi:hypothetical protein